MARSTAGGTCSQASASSCIWCEAAIGTAPWAAFRASSSMLAASCFSRISIRFRGPVSSIQALNRGPSRRERIARGTLCAATYFSACAGYLGHIGTKVRALDRAATRRVNTTPPLRSRYLSCFCSRSTWRSSSFLLLTHQKQQWSK